MSLKPCKAAELVATHFSEQIETVLNKLQVNVANIYGEETSSGETIVTMYQRTFDFRNLFN